MSNFDSLHPALQHHIVNSLGWKELRPFQDAAIPAVLCGVHSVILAPTAGGKTESAVFPLLSQMLSVPWAGLSVLYICPMKALINDLEARLQRYTNLLGRRASVWHGDISRGERDRILKTPPDLLITTPESLEAILVSSRANGEQFFGSLKAVVVDEIHLFAGDDRGWHLLALLARLTRISGHEFQRIGLSATVGNPTFLLEWLTGGCKRDARVLLPESAPPIEPDIRIDYVGSLENAATVVARVYRGEKRLVFVDSRARAEQLTHALRRLDIRVHLTHSSLSKDLRSRAEGAFRAEEDCVIVATSVLEVGVDVGDLQRVIQIDAPRSVSSLLQRMGRTGRRKDTGRNCLFLATRDESLLRAAALVRLFERGYVEPVQPPREPFHILAQQLLALCLQEAAIGKRDWFDWIGDVPAFRNMGGEEVQRMVTWMIENDILFESQGILSLGGKGEDLYGKRNFMELLSVFLASPYFTVLHGREELGHMDERTFMRDDGEEKRTIMLAGRSWQVEHIDWPRHQAFVKPADAPGSARWSSTISGSSFAVCQAMKDVLITPALGPTLSRRAAQRLDLLRGDFSWLEGLDKTYITADRRLEWWTFAGGITNMSICAGLQVSIAGRMACDDLKVIFPPGCTLSVAESAIATLCDTSATALSPDVDRRAIDGLKFSDLLPPELSIRAIQARFSDRPTLETILAQTLVVIGTR